MQSTTDSTVDLEIRIRRRDSGAYQIEAVAGSPGAASPQDAPLDLDLEELHELRYDPAAYGRALAEMLFAQPAIRSAYERARDDAASRGAGLRLILDLADDATLHGVHWETLYGPEGERPLALLPRAIFMRCAAGDSWRPLRPRPRGELRALAAIAPGGRAASTKSGSGGAYQDQLALQSAFGSVISHTILSDPGQATLADIRQRLREGFDILCLVADGTADDGEVSLSLAPSRNETSFTQGEQLARVLGGLLQPPRLVLLCVESDDVDHNTRAVTAGLALRVLAAGIPLVLALQGPPAMGANGRFLQALFVELERDGQADRAVAEARRAVGDLPDWWTPVLFSRVRSGSIWAEGAEDMATLQARGPLLKGASPVLQAADEAPPFAQQGYAEVSPVQQAADEAPPFAQQGYAEVSPVQQTADEAPPVQQAVVQGPPLSPAPVPADSASEASDAEAPPAVAPPTVAPPAVAPPPAQPIMVMVQQLEARYRPPAEALSLEVYADHVRFRFHNTDYASPHQLAEQAPDLWASLTVDPQRHGELLFAAVIRDEPWDGALSTRLGYERVRAEGAGELRIELNLRHRGFEQFRWEYLVDTTLPDRPPLAISARSPLYRRPPRGAAAADPGPGGPLKVCVALCSPRQLGDPAHPLLAKLEPLDLARQAEIIDDALAPLEAAGLAERVVLGAPGGPPATLEAIGEALDGGCSVLHLLAHGLDVAGAYHLVIDHEIVGGQPAFVPAETFAAALRHHGAALRLVVLGACRSAAAPELAGGGASLGARLVEGGVPAVIAMQDLVAVNTVQFFTQHFYDDLARSGRVEMAVAATRYDLYQWLQGGSPDWGIPVLYMGQGSGHLFDVDLAHAAAKLAPRAPVIKSFAKRLLDPDEIARRAARVAEARARGTVTAAEIEELRAAVAPTAPAQALMAREQRREQLSGLRRPMMIDAGELQRYVEQQADGLALAPSVYRQTAGALTNGKYVILTGPPGTGKTSLAHHISRFAAERGLIPGAVTTTASADWTTFDTVGGYMPTPQGVLQFRPGIFLRAICEGQWLVIDEINRAEIDKAFGELFTVLSGQPVDLPYWIGEHQVRIIPGLRERDPARAWVPATVSSPFDYVVHPNWRIIGAMNVYDKSSLFAMSFAFMRRFAFVDIEVPDVARYQAGLVDRWLGDGAAADRIRADLTAAVAALLGSPTLMARRALGPAIVMDIVRHVAHAAEVRQGEPLIEHVAEALSLYAVPQLDALDQETIGAIYAELQALYGASGSGAAMLARVRALYPHVRRDEWPQPAP